MVRGHPQWLEVKRLVDSGAIGELRLVSGHFSYFRRDPDDVRSRPEYGGGALMDIGCYPIMMSRWLFSAEPVEVVGQIEHDPDMKVDRLESALLRFPTARRRSPAPDSSCRIRKCSSTGRRAGSKWKFRSTRRPIDRRVSSRRREPARRARREDDRIRRGRPVRDAGGPLRRRDSGRRERRGLDRRRDREHGRHRRAVPVGEDTKVGIACRNSDIGRARALTVDR